MKKLSVNGLLKDMDPAQWSRSGESHNQNVRVLEAFFRLGGLEEASAELGIPWPSIGTMLVAAGKLMSATLTRIKP